MTGLVISYRHPSVEVLKLFPVATELLSFIAHGS